jgi:hypothetical protein
MITLDPNAPVIVVAGNTIVGPNRFIRTPKLFAARLLADLRCNGRVRETTILGGTRAEFERLHLIFPEFIDLKEWNCSFSASARDFGVGDQDFRLTGLHPV